MKRFDLCLHYPEGTASKVQVDPRLMRLDEILPRKLSNWRKNEKHNRRINEKACSRDSRAVCVYRFWRTAESQCRGSGFCVREVDRQRHRRWLCQTRT